MRPGRSDDWHDVPWHHAPRFSLPPEPRAARSRVIEYSSPAGARSPSRSSVTWRDVGFCTISISAISIGLFGCSVACWYVFQALFRRDTFDGDLLVMMFVMVGLLAWPAVIHTTLRGISHALRKHPIGDRRHGHS